MTYYCFVLNMQFASNTFQSKKFKRWADRVHKVYVVQVYIIE